MSKIKIAIFWSAVFCSFIGILYCTQKAPKPLPKAPVPVAQEVIPNDHFCAAIARRPKPPRAVGVIGRYWTPGQTLKIKFLNGTDAQHKYLMDAVTEWQKSVNLKVNYVTSGATDMRIGFTQGQGSWSYIGLDCKGIPSTQPTMNIGWAGLDVCLHEFGHALGMAHEQSSPKSTICWNKEAVYAALGGPPNNWDKATVDYNVFAVKSPTEAEATTFDPNSIMQYSIPAAWLCPPSNGIQGGRVLSDLDRSFMAAKYPGAIVPPVVQPSVSLPKWQRDSIVKWLVLAK